MLITYTVNKSKSLKAANRSCHAYAMAHSALVKPQLYESFIEDVQVKVVVQGLVARYQAPGGTATQKKKQILENYSGYSA